MVSAIGASIDVSPVHSRNPLILFTFGKFTDCIRVQPLNASWPISIALGKDKEIIDEHPKNADSSIVTTFDKFISDNNLQFWNAPFPIKVTCGK